VWFTYEGAGKKKLLAPFILRKFVRGIDSHLKSINLAPPALLTDTSDFDKEILLG
jgi:hypothetical protein